MNGPEPPPTYPSAWRRFVTLLPVMLASTTYELNITSVSVALPQMQGTFSATHDQASWVVTSFIVGMITMLACAGWLSDKFGRRPITAIGCVVMIVFPFVYFGLLDTKSLPLVFLAIVISNPLQDLQYGPQAAYIAESFPASLRYSGSALGYQLASITAGGPAPLIAALLYRQYGTSNAIAWYIVICSVIYSLFCLNAFTDLVIIDVAVYSFALILQFVTFLILRAKLPGLARPFRVPGG